MSDMSEIMNIFGQQVNAMEGGGDIGRGFPKSDADDFGHGARWIPGEVTLARRRGERVEFVRNCGRCCWYWKFQDGTRIYHWDPLVYDEIRRHNGKGEKEQAGPCQGCGNPHTSGGVVKAEAKAGA